MAHIMFVKWVSLHQGIRVFFNFLFLSQIVMVIIVTTSQKCLDRNKKKQRSNMENETTQCSNQKCHISKRWGKKGIFISHMVLLCLVLAGIMNCQTHHKNNSYSKYISNRLLPGIEAKPNLIIKDQIRLAGNCPNDFLEIHNQWRKEAGKGTES